ncbi:MAG: 16S rRNA (guanine(966)-N(2))-methyltransferase RsmD [Bacteroidota bacterium]
MRIIAGRYRRKALKAPKTKATRPTSDRTKEGLFNLLTHRMDLADAAVLDLFAGTGSLGLEALSRGAHRAWFVEQQEAVLKYARTNAAALDASSMCWFIRGDVVPYLKRYQGTPFDLILADPPYDLEALPKLPDLAIKHLAERGYFALEHDVRHDFSEHPHLDVSRAYGRTVVSLFAAAPPA